jgi:hypothetical protein
MVNKGAKQKLTQYLRSAAPSSAILLRGAWGSGKSFFWNGFKERQLPKLRKKDITFSVAGLATLEELEQAMFLASVKDLGTDTFRETGTVVGRALLRLVKVDPDDIKLKADVRSGKTVICIDDLERFGGDFKVLFGFIVSLLDAAKLHVVLISEEERAVQDLTGYQDYKEKIISVTAEVRPDIEAFYEDTVKGFEHKATHDALLDIQGHAVSFFKEKKLKNLRTLRSILEEMKLIMQDMIWPEGQDASLGALLSAVSFHVMAVTKDVTNEALVSEVFLHGDLANMTMMGRAVSKKNTADEVEGAGGSVRRLIDALGFDSDIYQWHGSKAFAEYVTAEGFEPDEIAQDFQVFGYVQQEGQPLLVRFRSYRAMDEAEFRTCVAELETKVKKRDFQNMQEIWEAHEILDHLSHEKLITTTPEVWRDRFVKLAHEFKVTSDTPSSFSVWLERQDPNRAAVLEALKVLEQRILEEKTMAENEATRRDLIEGKGDAVLEVFNAAPFAQADASNVYERLQKAGRDGINRMTQFFRKRIGISNLQDFATSEVPFAKALGKLIDANIPNIAPIKLDDAAWWQLAAVLHDYVSRLSPASIVHHQETQP